MRHWLSEHRRVRAVALVLASVVGSLVLLALLLVGIDQVADHPQADTDPAQPSQPFQTMPSPSETSESTKGEPPRRAPVELPDTGDPDTYAAAIAEVLFGMDYSKHLPSHYEELLSSALWDAIAPDDRSRLIATMSRRIPTPEIWKQMRSVDQRAEFEVELVWEPRTGRQGRSEGWWPNGVVLRNVSGIQTEIWRGADQRMTRSSREVAVTVGIACAPAASPCRLVSIQPNVES